MIKTVVEWGSTNSYNEAWWNIAVTIGMGFSAYIKLKQKDIKSLWGG